MIDATRLHALSPRLSSHYALHAPHWDRRSPLLEGSMELCQIQPGMFLRLAKVKDRYDLQSEAELRPGLKLAWVLDGQAEVSFADRPLHLGPQAAPGSPQAIMVPLESAELFHRQGWVGRHECTLTMTLSEEWLASNGMPARGTHLKLQAWRPSSTLAVQARRVIRRGGLSAGGLSGRLMTEALALTMLGEALASHGGDAPTMDRHRVPLGQSEDRRMRRLKELIDSGEADGCTQSQLAERLAMSLSTLQRQFRRHCGESLGTYLRHRRLRRARRALEHEGMELDTAAELAGYASTANFATAFKQRFGISPSQLRD